MVIAEGLTLEQGTSGVIKEEAAFSPPSPSFEFPLQDTELASLQSQASISHP